MKKLTALVTYKYEDNAHKEIIERDTYETKKAFREDLVGNGYTVHSISTEEDMKARNVGYQTATSLKRQLEKYGVL
jgi:hypothetical protein